MNDECENDINASIDSNNNSNTNRKSSLDSKVEITESIVLGISEMKKQIRVSKLMLFIFLSFFTIAFGTIAYGIFFYSKSPHVSFIHDFSQKTVIGIKNSGAIKAITDDKTGEVTIEVYHGKK